MAEASGLPHLDAANPDKGPTTGGTFVTLTGELLQHVNDVTFSGNKASNVKAVDPSKVTCISPPGSLGLSEVIAENDAGEKSNHVDFTYIEPPPK